MKKITEIKNELSALQILSTDQAAQIKGGDDQRSPRPGGGGPVGLSIINPKSGSGNGSGHSPNSGSGNNFGF